MWWNRSKTPPRSQEGQLRELSQRVAEMESDFEKVFNLIAKINGRLRQRERRADIAADRDDSFDAGDGGDRAPDLVAPIQPVETRPENSGRDSAFLMPPTYTKEQLREFARQRGFLRQ